MEVLSENAQYYVEELERDLPASSSRAEAERLRFDLSKYHRMAAVGRLLSDADVVAFAKHLRRSAEMRIMLLQDAQDDEGVPNRFTCASQIAPFFDALAAGETELATNIAKLSPREWASEDEFEDEFWYARFLYHLLLNGLVADEDALDALANYERVSPDGQNGRSILCRAFVDRDQECFDEGLATTIEERAAALESKTGTLITKRLEFETERHLFVEGLAILRLADSIGMATAREYTFIPHLARLPSGS